MNAMDHFTSTPGLGDGAPARCQCAVVRGRVVRIGDAHVSLEGDALRWEVDRETRAPAAGSGVASGIVDALLHGKLEAQSGALPVGQDAAKSRERAIPVDQTNTSVIVDERWVVKIVGAWGVADRSAAILERLRDESSGATPEFLGGLEWEHPERGRSALALVAEYVPNSEDGWTWAADDVVAHLRRGAEAPTWPALLGSLAANMHAALRVRDEAPDPRVGDRARAASTLERACALITSSDEPQSPRPAGFVDRLRARRPALAAAIETIPAHSTAPLVTPHGDFHVGQILRTADQRYFVLDFDGDPQWPAEQRFRPDGAARDVAHMLVSIDLVAAVAQRRLGGADERAWDWSETAQRDFREAYLAGVEPGLLDEAAIPGLMAEQLLAEITYAETYLPEWRYAPDGVITRRYPRTGALIDSQHDSQNDTQNLDDEELPWTPPALPTT